MGAGPTGLTLACLLAAEGDRMTRMATLRSPGARAARNGAIRTIGRIPAFRRWLASELAGLRNR